MAFLHFLPFFKSGMCWSMLKALRSFVKSSEVAKFWQKMKKIDFSFFVTHFSQKNEKFCFLLETISMAKINVFWFFFHSASTPILRVLYILGLEANSVFSLSKHFFRNLSHCVRCLEYVKQKRIFMCTWAVLLYLDHF